MRAGQENIRIIRKQKIVHLDFFFFLKPTLVKGEQDEKVMRWHLSLESVKAMGAGLLLVVPICRPLCSPVSHALLGMKRYSLNDTNSHSNQRFSNNILNVICF